MDDTISVKFEMLFAFQTGPTKSGMVETVRLEPQGIVQTTIPPESVWRLDTADGPIFLVNQKRA